MSSCQMRPCTKLHCHRIGLNKSRLYSHLVLYVQLISMRLRLLLDFSEKKITKIQGLVRLLYAVEGEQKLTFPSSIWLALRQYSHTPFASSANIQAGITIDLSLVNDIVVSEDRSQVHVGVGNRWGAVNHVLDPLNLATATGRISGVGVGGFTSGGDYPILYPININ
jgi:hypothetical protein